MILDAENAGAYSGRVRDARELERMIEYHAAVQTSPTANVILIAKMRSVIPCVTRLTVRTGPSDQTASSESPRPSIRLQILHLLPTCVLFLGCSYSVFVPQGPLVLIRRGNY